MRKIDILEDHYNFIMGMDDIKVFVESQNKKSSYPNTFFVISGKIVAVLNNYSFDSSEKLYEFIQKCKYIISELNYKNRNFFCWSSGDVRTMSLSRVSVRTINMFGILINKNTDALVKQDLLVNYINLLPEVFETVEEIKNDNKEDRTVRIVRPIFKAGNERPSENSEMIFNSIKLKDLTAELLIKTFIPEKTWTDAFRLMINLI